MPELVFLVPELCRQTGLSDAMRANFQLMRALDAHTKIGPDMRIKKLLSFNRRFTETQEVTQVCVQRLYLFLLTHKLYKP